MVPLADNHHNSAPAAWHLCGWYHSEVHA